MSRAAREAERAAIMLKRRGYPDAVAAPEYCIDGDIGPDGFYTFTVCAYAGKKRPDKQKRGA
jgi:hypothetical protein